MVPGPFWGHGNGRGTTAWEAWNLIPWLPVREVDSRRKAELEAEIAELESEFEVMFDTDHIIDMSSVAKAKDILTTLGIAF